MSESKKQDSINHHYVPQWLQKQWYRNDEQGKESFVKYTKLFNDKIIRRNSVSCSTGSEEHLNTVFRNIFSKDKDHELIKDSNTIEDYFGKLDNDASEIFIRNKCFASLSREDKYKFSKFILSLNFRHPNRLEFVRKEVEKKGEKPLTYLKNVLEKENLIEHLVYFQYTTTLKTMIPVLDDTASYKHIAEMEWFDIVAEEDAFLGGEFPIVVKNNEDDDLKIIRNFIFALSPRHLVVGLNSEMVKLISEKENGDLLPRVIANFAAEYNSLLSSQSRYVISSKILSVDELQLWIEPYLQKMPK